MKTRRTFLVVIVAGLTVLGGWWVRSLNRDTNKDKDGRPRLEVGWQTAWATCGQLIETLVHTNIPELYETGATFRNFLFGPDMNEAALTGSIDATTTGIVPTVNLLAASDDWVIVCRLIDFPVSIVSRTGAGITNVEDLRGRRVGVPFGSGAHPPTLQLLKEHDLPIGTDPGSVDLRNISPAESVAAIQQGAVDAIATWEPQTTIIESRGLGRSINDQRFAGMLTVRKSIVEQYPMQVENLVAALIEAHFYVARNRKQTDEWFARRSNFDLALLNKIRVVEPNVNVGRIEDVSVELSAEDLSRSQVIANQMFAAGLIRRPIDLSKRMNSEIAKRAWATIQRSGSKLNEITSRGAR